MQAELEELMFLSPEEFARSVPRDGFGGVAADLTRSAAGGRTAAVRLLFSFVSERGKKRPRRARLPARIRQKLDRAMSQENPEAVAEKRQTQGITPLHRAQGRASPKGSRGGAENSEAKRPRLPAMRDLGELRGARGAACASQGITRRTPAAFYCSRRDTEGTEFRRSGHVSAHSLREIRDIRGPPCKRSV